MRIGSLVIAAALLTAPLTAAAQSWENYDYQDAGFAVHFPAPPSVTTGVYKTTTGETAPATIYSVRRDDIIYTVTRADFTKLTLDGDKAINDAVKSFEQLGKIQLDVDARINRQYGHELSVGGKDGSRFTVAIFFFNHHLYQLQGQAMPPDPDRRSGQLIRFQQSLQFPFND